MRYLNELNKYGNHPRVPGMDVRPDKVDEYMKQTFGLTDKELKQLEDGTFDMRKYCKRIDKLPRPVFEYNFIPNKNSRQK